MAYIKQIIQHKLYRPVEYDLSILVLDRDLKIDNHNTKIAKLNFDTLKNDQLLTVSGWGRLYDGGPIPDDLQAVDVKVIDYNTCNKMYKGALSKYMYCAGYVDGYYDSCQGDSGGPITNSKDQVVGVVSWGIGCAEPGHPGIYVNIRNLKDWIKTHIKQNAH